MPNQDIIKPTELPSCHPVTRVIKVEIDSLHLGFLPVDPHLPYRFMVSNGVVLRLTFNIHKNISWFFSWIGPSFSNLEKTQASWCWRNMGVVHHQDPQLVSVGWSELFNFWSVTETHWWYIFLQPRTQTHRLKIDVFNKWHAGTRKQRTSLFFGKGFYYRRYCWSRFREAPYPPTEMIPCFWPLRGCGFYVGCTNI